MNWIEYTEAAQRLAEARRREVQRLAGVRQRSSGMRGSVDQLKQRLTAQREHLVTMAGRLRLPAPSLGEIARSGLTDTDEALRRAREAIEQADVTARRAEERGYQPILLPGVHPLVRNGLVYAGTTALCALVSCGLVLFGTAGPDHRFPLWTAPWSLCGLPAVAFFAGYLIIASFGRPRIDTGERASRSVRLGGLICFLGLWLVWAVGVSVQLTS
jgi:hypothetical protein